MKDESNFVEDHSKTICSTSQIDVEMSPLNLITAILLITLDVRPTNSIFGLSFPGPLRSLWNGLGKVDNSYARVMDAVQTGHSGIDNTVNGVTSYLKQITSGTMSEMTLETYHKLCSAYIGKARSIRKPPQTFLFKFVLMTPCKNFTYSITDVESMWQNEAFDPKKRTVIFVTGWLLTLNHAIAPIVHTVSKAYLCRGDVNFIAIDPENYMLTFYEWAALSTQDIGRSLASALILLNNKVDPSSIHLIGHSLGAHTIAAAARIFKSMTGRLLGRLTGLDPANPCFNMEGVLIEISKGDAEYVDIIHTNPGVLGKKEAIGDSDFYPNGFYAVQIGCVSDVCAHNRAWEYYAESVYPDNENNFLAAQCEIKGRFDLNECGNFDVPMGYSEKKVKGRYFLATNFKSPYGKNATSKRYYPSCGLCGSKYRY